MSDPFESQPAKGELPYWLRDDDYSAEYARRLEAHRIAHAAGESRAVTREIAPKGHPPYWLLSAPEGMP